MTIPIAATLRDFEYFRSDLAVQVHFIGPLLSTLQVNFTPPAWWDELKGNKPIIHVTQGTVATNPNDLIVPTLHALKHENVLVIATTGSGEPTESIKLADTPVNARIEQFIPHSHLLPLVDIIVTNELIPLTSETRYRMWRGGGKHQNIPSSVPIEQRAVDTCVETRRKSVLAGSEVQFP